MRTVTLISKDDCSLCDKALEVLEQVHEKIPFRLEINKITPGTEEFRRYGERVPVVLVDNTEVFFYSVNPQRLERILRRSS